MRRLLIAEMTPDEIASSLKETDTVIVLGTVEWLQRLQKGKAKKS